MKALKGVKCPHCGEETLMQFGHCCDGDLDKVQTRVMCENIVCEFGDKEVVLYDGLTIRTGSKKEA